MFSNLTYKDVCAFIRCSMH